MTICCRTRRGRSFAELVQYHVSGQLKVAPEHCVNRVLDYMGKPHIEVYEQFQQKYDAAQPERYGKEQYLVPYLMSSHPGSTLDDAVALAEWLNASRPAAGAGAGLLSDARHPVHLYVLHGHRPAHHEAGVCSPPIPTRKPSSEPCFSGRCRKTGSWCGKRCKRQGERILIGFDARCLIRPYPPRAKKVGEKGGEKRPKGKPEVGKGKKSTGRVEKKAGGKKRKG